MEHAYAMVNGVEIYWESQGSGGTPLLVTHGGFGTAGMLGALGAGTGPA